MTTISEIITDATSKFGFVIGYETKQFTALGELLSGAKRFVDVGANRGIYSWMANRLCENCEIVLIEANPELCKDLRDEISSWKGSNSVDVLQYAAGDCDGNLDLNIGIEDTVSSFVASDYGTIASVSVPVRPLDTLLEPQSGTVFKIDVEGFEYRVIAGAKGHLLKDDCKLIVELHGWGDHALRKYPIDVLFLLANLGYVPKRCGDSHFIFIKGPVATRALMLAKYGPRLFAKGLVRRSGLRDTVYRLLYAFGLRRKIFSGLSASETAHGHTDQSER